jgi:hypothetical protein
VRDRRSRKEDKQVMWVGSPLAMFLSWIRIEGEPVAIWPESEMAVIYTDFKRKR